MKKLVLFCLATLFAIGLTSFATQKSNRHNLTRTVKNGREIVVKKHKSKSPFTKTATVLFSEDFSNGLPNTWTTTDNDGDGFGWEYDSIYSFAMVSYSYDNESYSALTPDNYLITPQITIPAGSPAVLEFETYAIDGDWPFEHYSVLVSPSGAATVDSFNVNLLNDTLQSDTPITVRLSLMQFAGTTIRIAIHHHDSVDMFGMAISRVEVNVPEQTDIAVTGASTPRFGTFSNNETLSATVENFGSQTQNDLAVYCDVNGTLYTDTIASLASLQRTSATFTGVDMSQLGNYNISFYVNVSGDSDRSNDTISTVTTNTPAASLTWDFEGDTVLPQGFSVASYDGAVAHNTNIFPNNEPWTLYNYNESLGYFEFGAGMDGGSNAVIAQSWFTDGFSGIAANRWIIMPQIRLTTGNFLMWDATTYEAAYPEDYVVKVSTTNLDTASFTTICTVESEEGDWVRHIVDLSAYNGQDVYIAFVLKSLDENMLMLDNLKILDSAILTADTTVNPPLPPVALQLAENDGVNIFPNPASEKITLTAESAITSVEIIDLTGRTVLRKEANTKEMDISNLRNGIYTMRIVTEKSTALKRLIKK